MAYLCIITNTKSNAMKITAAQALFLNQFRGIEVSQLTINGKEAPRKENCELDMLLSAFLKKGKAESVKICDRLGMDLVWIMDGFTFRHPVPNINYKYQSL